jgi:hypothetical protein
MGHGMTVVDESHWKMTKPMPLSGGASLVTMSESSRQLKEARQRHLEKDLQKHKQAHQPKRQEAQHERKETRTPVRRLGLYERSIKERQQKEAKLQSIRKELMHEYTFTPKIPSSSTSSRTATTNASSCDSVFDRLYRNAGSSSIATPTSVQASKQHPPGRTSSQKKPPTSYGNPWSSTASGVTKNSTTSRIDELYHSGVLKARSRPQSDREEKEARERRREAKELRECTFRPQTNWTKPEDASSSKLSMTSTNHHVQGRIGISPREQPRAKTTVVPVSKQRRTPPREISVEGSSFIQQAVMDAPHKDKARGAASGSGTPWQTPVRRRRHRHHQQELPIISDYTMVSPLRDPSVIEESSLLFHRDSNLPSTRIPIYLRVAIADGDNATSTDDTEYGSI